MSRPPVQQYSGHPSVGATFVPGGSDDFYLPEVVSPKPKRYALLVIPAEPPPSD